MTGGRQSQVLVAKGSVTVSEVAAQVPHASITVVDTSSDLCHGHATGAVALVLRSGFALGAAELACLQTLRAVIRPGSGLDNIDVDELMRRHITLYRAPEIGATAVGEWVLLAALMLSRRAAAGSNGLAAGQHLKSLCMGVPLAAQRIAIWGAGPVGQAAAAILRPMVADVWFADWPSAPAELPRRTPQWLCRNADLHVAAVPGRPSTEAMFGKVWLDLVRGHRPSLICAGRLSTLDVAALLAALRADELAGLAIDPIEVQDAALLAQAAAEALNLFITPHLAAQRRDVRQRYDGWVVQQLRTVLTGR